MVQFTEQALRKANSIKPIEFFKPVKDEDGKESEKYYITDQCNVYYKQDIDEYKYLSDCEEKAIQYDKDGRPKAIVDYKDGHNKSQDLPEVLLRTFDESTEFTPEFFKTHEANHINPERPLDNSIFNLEWIIHEESGAMIRKYDKDIVHKICQMTCDGKSRMEIRQELGVNGQFVDDIRAGRSHKDISSQYLDKGFEYKVSDRPEKRERAEEICKLLAEGHRPIEIVRKMGLPNVSVVNDIKHKRAYKYISDNYF